MEYSELTKNINVSRETFDRLSHYVELLQKWNKRINLVSDDRTSTLWHRHLLDSLQLIDHIPNNPKHPSSIIDMGSGGGLPGIVIGAALNQPITLIESDRRKAIFLQQVTRELQLAHVRVVCARVEKISLSADIITSRALASIADLLNYSAPKLRKNAFCLFLKGQNWDKELDRAGEKWSFDTESWPSITSDTGRIIKLKNIALIES